MMLIVYGPTATGKTNLAIRLAKKFSAEIISADSRQVYKGLDIGTGKVHRHSKIEKHEGYWIVDGVKIHGFDLIEPDQQFTAADFLKFANTSMIRIIEEHKTPIIVGGTGFYVKALIDGIKSIGIPADPKLRQKLEKLSVDQLYDQLEKADPPRAKAMNKSDRKNPRRLIRAIEIASSSQQPSTHYSLPTTDFILVGLTAPNEYLYLRADEWLATRLQEGMIDEIRDLVKDGTDPNWLENLGLEYRWLTRLITGKIGKDLAVERLKGDIHNFIRRQKTWFSKFKNNLPAGRQVKLYDISKPKWQSELEKEVSVWYNQVNDTGKSPDKS